MKKSIFIPLVFVLFTVFTLPAIGQIDTLAKPDGIGAFEDPKITDDNNSKILIDTTTNVDSLMDENKASRKAHQHYDGHQPMKEHKTDKPGKNKKAPIDSGRMVKP